MENACDALIEDKFKVEKRMMIEACVNNCGNIKKYYALNDIVIAKSGSPIISIDLYSCFFTS